MGILYGGISMIKDGFPLLRDANIFSITAAAQKATAAPNRYRKKITSQLPAEKKYPPMVIYTGSRAEQLIKGVIIAVFLRIFSSSSPLVVITAVAEQPNPISMVIALLPDRPIFPNKPSVMNARREI